MKPILFSTEMVRAILDGRKTMTRRVVKSDAKFIQWQPVVLNGYGGFCDEHGNPVKCRYEIGDTLWVRETWQTARYAPPGSTKLENVYIYKADGGSFGEYEITKWEPSIFMPLEACRLYLRITDIRVERLQDITEEDAIAEGVERNPEAADWAVMCGKESWDANPYVWVIKFERIKL